MTRTGRGADGADARTPLPKVPLSSPRRRAYPRFACIPPASHPAIGRRKLQDSHLRGLPWFRGPASVAGLLSLTVFAAPAAAQTVLPDHWGVLSGAVTSIVRAANTIYIGGDFAYVGPSTGGGIPLDPVSGAPLRPFARVAGVVRAVISDGGGGWFIGGDFTGVEGEARLNVAHVRSDGSVSEWQPRVVDPERYLTRGRELNPAGIVDAMVLKGHTLYLGGRFKEIDGQPRLGLAAVDANTGELLPWTCDTDGHVMALAIHASTLYVGGRFVTIGGQPHQDLAAVDLKTGAPEAWTPAPDGTPFVFAFHGRTLFVGGEFSHIAGEERNSIAAFDLGTRRLEPWNAALEPQRDDGPIGAYVWPFVADIVINGSTLYAGGSFDHAGGIARYGVVGLDLDTARPTAFDPGSGGYRFVKALALHAGALYVGGYFGDIGGAQRPSVAALDPHTGTRPLSTRAFTAPCRRWPQQAARCTQAVTSRASTTGARLRLAAFDAHTGTLLPWNPQIDTGRISQLASSDQTLYVAGSFTAIDGQPRGHLAAFDAATGALTDWNPWSIQVPLGEDASPSGTYPIQRMVRIGNTLFLSGRFEQFNGIPRHNMAAVNATTGELLDWAPNPRGNFSYLPGEVRTMVAREDTLFVAGGFDSIGSVLRRDLAALDARTGQTLAFDVQPGFYPFTRHVFDDPDVWTIAAGKEGVFVGGWWNQGIAGAGPLYLTAFDALGRLLPMDLHIGADVWAASVGRTPVVRDLLLRDGTLFVAGRFDEIGGLRASNLAAIDAATGVPIDWNPDIGGGLGYHYDGAQTLCLSGALLYVGGSFSRIGGYPAGGFGAVSLAPVVARSARPMEALPQAVVLAPPSPNPACKEAQLAFSLPEPGRVTLSIFDLQGRRVAQPFAEAALPAGRHEARVSVEGWRPGCYFARLDVAGVRITKRLVVVR